jgi:hypothetical protein
MIKSITDVITKSSTEVYIIQAPNWSRPQVDGRS